MARVLPFLSFLLPRLLLLQITILNIYGQEGGKKGKCGEDFVAGYGGVYTTYLSCLSGLLDKSSSMVL